MTSFAAWQRELRDSRKLGPVLYVVRYRTVATTIRLTGDYTGAVLRGEVRAWPDAPGPASATFTVGAAVVEDGNTFFTVALEAAARLGGAPDPAAPKTSVAMAYDFLLKLDGEEDEERLFAGVLQVQASVTR